MTERGALTTREELINALTEAASFEHCVICQYLFAAFSLKADPSEGSVTWTQLEHIRAWKSDILLVAREEMEHLGLVCNLLTAIGGIPYFRRPNFPHSSRPGLTDHEFVLERFSETTIERFLHFEQMHSVTPAPEADETNAPLALSDAYETIGDLYQRIRSGFEYVNENTKLLFVGPSTSQVDNATLDLPKGWFDFNLLNVADIESALQAIDQIVEAGDGIPHHADASHYQRFREILTDLEKLRRADPSFEPARPVAVNPHIREPRDDMTMPGTLLTHPHTRRAVKLYNTAYETMLLMLLRFYAPIYDSAEERSGLCKIAFFPMMTMVLRPLGELLTLMPAHDDFLGQTAGPSFECDHSLQLHPDVFSAWTILHERLQSMVLICADLNREIGRLHSPWAKRIQPRLSFLHENLTRMAYNFEQYMHLSSARIRFLMKKLF